MDTPRVRYLLRFAHGENLLAGERENFLGFINLV